MWRTKFFMADYTPKEMDSYFFLDIAFVWLMLVFNLPLGIVYTAMVLLDSLMYYVGLDQRVIHAIPFAKRSITFPMIAIGIGAGFLFYQFYNTLSSGTPLFELFSTPEFAGSQTIKKIVDIFLIPYAETKFFFRTVMQFVAYKANLSTSHPFGRDGLVLA